MGAGWASGSAGVFFCDVRVPFARQYIRRAARQGHADAIDRMKELCS